MEWTKWLLISRNYHVFYYLLLGASEEERKEFKLLPPEEYFYLKQVQYSVVYMIWFLIHYAWT